jgi:hypothetical protein
MGEDGENGEDGEDGEACINEGMSECATKFVEHVKSLNADE